MNLANVFYYLCKEETMKKTYYELVDLIRKKGTTYPKRHGEYKQLEVIPGYELQLDTWNNSVTCFKRVGERLQIFKHIGTDWGRFECDEFWTKYFLAHINKNT